MQGKWDSMVSSLQEVYKINEKVPLDDDSTTKMLTFSKLDTAVLEKHMANFKQHTASIESVRELLRQIIPEIDTVSAMAREEETRIKKELDSKIKKGKSYWASPFNPNEPILVGSEVAFKPKIKGSDSEWFQCEVLKIGSDGLKFEVRDPEPDELGNKGKTFKATAKDILLIPSREDATGLVNYPYGTRVLARYPETTTFYAAEVVGTKRDGTCRLKFEGEEEVDKETEVERRLVLPFPKK